MFYINTVIHLILKDLTLFKSDVFGKFINASIQLITSVVVFSFFLPSYGLQIDYGPFVLVGIVAGFGFFEIVGKVGQMVADIEGDKTILYTLSLPIPCWLVFIYFALSWSTQSVFICFSLFSIGKLLFFNEFDIRKIDLLNLFFILLLSNLFFSFFSLWLSSIIRKLSNLSDVFVRFINPMYMFGGFLYSWYSIYEISHLGGYVSLLNPLIYVMEGIRSAVLGPSEFLPFWVSFGILFLFTAIFALEAVRKLKNRLDCI